MTEQKQLCKECIEKKEEEKQEEPKWVKVPAVTLAPSAFREAEIYRSEREMNEAIRNGTFELRRTMTLKNGRLFFMCRE